MILLGFRATARRPGRGSCPRMANRVWGGFLRSGRSLLSLDDALKPAPVDVVPGTEDDAGLAAGDAGVADIVEAEVDDLGGDEPVCLDADPAVATVPDETEAVATFAESDALALPHEAGAADALSASGELVLPLTAHDVHEDERLGFRVTTFGLAPRFHRLLEIICRHARHNPYRFVIGAAMDQATTGLSGLDFDIAVVDVTTHDGTETARLLKLLPAGRPVIEVGRRLHHARGSDDIQLRNFSLEVLTVLNHTAEAMSRRGARRSRLLRSETILASAEGRRRRPPRVLVVDASPSIRSQVAVAIRRIGADAEEAATLAAALEIVVSRRYELVITELDLPDGDGFELIRRLRQLVSRRRPPVVVLSERDGWIDQARAAPVARCCRRPRPAHCDAVAR